MRLLHRAALIIALLALLAIGARPHWRTAVAATEVVLATPGADAATVRRLADSLGGVPVLGEARAVRRLASLRRVHVVGWGLDPETWHEMDSIPVTFHPAAVAAGISRISWPAMVPLGDDVVVEGAVRHVPDGAVIALIDPGGGVDSAALDGAGTFQLTAHPRSLGPMLGVLRVSIHDRAVVQETIGVSVVAPRVPRLLILEASPRFETRALRDWLTRHHGAVAIRSAISRDRFRSEFVNRSRVGLDALTPRLLSQFDVVVIDGRTLAGLASVERAELRRAVTDAGLGVLIEPDTVTFDSSTRFSDRDFFFGFGFAPIRGVDERSVRPVWPGGGARRSTTAPLPAAPYTLTARFGIEPLMEDGTGGIVTQVAPRGAGRVGLSVVRESARWVRMGEPEAFAAYWSRLLTALDARGSVEDWEIGSPGPWLVNRPVALSVDGPGDHPVAILAGPSGARDSVFLGRDPLVSTRWRGLVWPREAGWHRVEVASGPSFYVQTDRAWRSRQSAELLDATARYLVRAGPLEPRRESTPAPLSRPVPAGWFFGLFLLSAAVLWSRRRPG
jgi:hypothetical protein